MKRQSLLLMTVLSLATIAWSQTAESPAPPPAPPPPTPAASNAATNAVAGDKKDLISVDFPNEEVRTILRNVADLFELNLVVPDTLTGRSSIKLRNVTWRQIFKEILTPIKYTYIEDGNIIRVVSIESQLQEPVGTEVFVLNYSRAAEIQPTIAALVDQTEAVKGRIQIDQRNNALVITERPSRLSRIRPIIEKLDVATAQVMIESKFIDVTTTNGKDIGLNWASLQNLGVGMNGPIESTLASQTSFTTPTAPAQFQPKGAVSTNQSVVSSNGIANTLMTLFQAPSIVTATFSIDEFRTILSALQTQNNARLVSNPTVVTLNNIEATINVGESYPIPNYQYNQERGSFEVSGFNYKDIGINMKVTPQVNNAGFIKLVVEPEVTSRNASDVVTFGTATIPIIKQKKTKTQISLKNGFTMGIGGLTETTTSKGNSRVPLLGDIPVLGNLFKSKSTSQTIHNLVVFITARTLDSGEPKVEEIFDSRMIRNMEIKREDLPGYRSPEPAMGDATTTK